MSESSQVFIRTNNPVHLIKADRENTSIFLNWDKALGTAEHTVLAFYHQWCYGITLASAVHRVLSFHVKDRKHMGEFHPFMAYPEMFISWGLNRHDFNEGFDVRCIERYIEFYTFLLSINAAPWKYGRGYGVEAFRCVNLDEDKRGTMYNFKKIYEDNGICIIDAINQKYAFLNISQGFGYINLPKNTPLSAVEYVRAFYPDKRDNFRKSMRPIEKDEVFIENAKALLYVERKFRSFKVLTKEEIAEILPQKVTNKSVQVTPAQFLTQNNII